MIAALTVFVILGAIGFLPLFGGPGYEHALASGLVVPSVAAVTAALRLSRGDSTSPLASVQRGLSIGLCLAAVAYATALLHGLRVGMCDLAGGTVFFALTAGVGGMMGGAWGAAVASVCRWRRWRALACVLLALAGPIGGIAVSLTRFYGSPMVFAYDPFFGYFSGTLYDTVVDVRPELWTYRAGSLVTLGGITLVASALPLSTAARSRLWGGVMLLAASIVHSAAGPALGHWQTSSSIAAALGGSASGPRCDVLYPDSLLPDPSRLLVRDCEQQLAADEARLGAHLEGRLTAFVFADSDSKRRLMGAAETSIAKPWRREVYVQLAGYPHPVLGHEIAHVVAGTFARGPFRVAGALGGALPDPGLIEGVAVATSPDDDELTDAQWARAMLDLGLLPDVRSLFSLGFLGENADKSYTVAGAFVAWLRDRAGAPVIGAWYGGASIEALTGQDWGALDAAFRASLSVLDMPPEASAYARARFERPSVWRRKCPHAVDALDRAADQCRDQHRVDRATELYSGALARDPHDWHAELDRARLDARFGDEARGRGALARLASDELAPRTQRDRAEEALADEDVLHGQDARAAAAYRAIASRTLDEDIARTLEVKAMSLDDPGARRAVVDLLIGEPGRPADPWLGALSLGYWAGDAQEPLAAYLLGKNLARHDEWARAAAWLDRAIHQGAPTARMGREVLRQRAIAACALGDVDALGRVERATRAPESPFAGTSGGRREWVLRLIARCAAP